MKECTLLKLCCDKSLAYLRWQATLTFAETIRFTAEWYRAFYAPAGGAQDMYAFTMGQILEYADKARAKGLEWTA